MENYVRWRLKILLPATTCVVSAILLLAAGCGDRLPPPDGSSDQSAGIEEQAAESAVDMNNHPGKKVYDENCLPCHQADGYGVPGMHPPIVGTEWVLGDKNRLIGIVLQGMAGEIEVDGEIYDSVMAPADYLTDEEIAAVLTYLRKSFGNNASEVTVAEVQKVRDSP
jgi:mono/diheme cytochrome c family protein